MANGFTFNGIHSSVHGIGVKAKRPLIPGVSDNYIDLPGRAGSFLYPGKPLDRYIIVECGIQPDRALFKSKIWEIAAWLYTQDRTLLVFDDEPGMIYKAKIEGAVDLEQVGTIGKFTLILRCDPFAYGAEVTETFSADALTLTNSGTYEAYPRFTASFTGSASEWKVTHGSGLYIRVVDSFVYGDVLTIDSATGAILKNDVRTMNKLDWQYSKLFALAVGSNTLTITPPGICSAQVKYDPTFL
ncbi:MAG: distal tail protein Dit [Syntrophomonas sp.]